MAFLCQPYRLHKRIEMASAEHMLGKYNAVPIYYPHRNVTNYKREIYYTYIDIGTPPQRISVDLDIAFNYTAVPSVDCTQCAYAKRTFNCSASSTCINSSTILELNKSPLYLNGTMANDTFNFNSTLSMPFTFQLITNQTGFDNFPCDGIMGLSYFASKITNGVSTSLIKDVFVLISN